MASDRYAVHQLGDEEFTPLRLRLGIEAFGVTVRRAAAGKEIVSEHAEEGDDGNEELYVALSGAADFVVDGEAVSLPAGGCLAVRSGAARRATATEDGTSLLIVGSTRGQAYRADGWELGYDAFEIYKTGDYEAARAAYRNALDQAPESAILAYNLGCCEALTGHPEDAIEHVARAVEARPSLRELAQTDTDLDSIRADPRFPAAQP
ncbi:MAG TPA: tetratricopeptide repeat protein [Gaiellales bacterium]|nr:tetratricopeptide repeat protein [Gaiellales bacterium]